MATEQELMQVAERAAERAAQRFAAGAPSVQEIEQIAERAAEAAVSRSVGPAVTRAVAETLAMFGVDTEKKNETLRDMLFLRDMRLLSTDSKKQVLTAVLGAVVTSALSVFGALFFAGKLTGKVP